MIYQRLVLERSSLCRDRIIASACRFGWDLASGTGRGSGISADLHEAMTARGTV